MKDYELKKITIRQRDRIKKISYLHRNGVTKRRFRAFVCSSKSNYNYVMTKLEENKSDGFDFIVRRRNIIVNLPMVMNFNEYYEVTATYINMIRELSSLKPRTRKCLRLRRVNFSGLKEISSPAALVLTAELAKWDDKLNHTLKPEVGNWDQKIIKYLSELGYFDLFCEKPSLPDYESSSSVRIAKYIKGSVGDAAKIRQLKSAIIEIVGTEVEKWMFLGSGLEEAITNVSHHAYPPNVSYLPDDKSWYMTGAYDVDSKELKVIFYDQGIGIPKTLPASTLWEKVKKKAEKLSEATGLSLDNYDATMIRAAMEVSRTRTGEEERGKGLKDMLEFLNQRGQGYLSILSLKGLYRRTISGEEQQEKSVQFQTPLPGTLIIWTVKLAA